MENMWLMAQSLGISSHVMSVFSSASVENELRKLLQIPKHMKVAFGMCLGYPKSRPKRYLRIRRDVEDFTYYNGYRNKMHLEQGHAHAMPVPDA